MVNYTKYVKKLRAIRCMLLFKELTNCVYFVVVLITSHLFTFWQLNKYFRKNPVPALLIIPTEICQTC